MTRRVDELQPRVEELTGQRTSPFAGRGAVVPPLVLAGLVTLLFHGPRLSLPTPVIVLVAIGDFLGVIPQWVAFWGYVQIGLALDWLGRQPLALRPFDEDRSLGLRPFGNLAFELFVVYVAIVVPPLIVTASNLASLVLNSGILALGVGLFFLSMYRLHRQLVAAKAEWWRWAQALTAEAMRPLKQEVSTAALEAQAAPLMSADSVGRHVAAIQEWPVGDGILRTVAGIATGVLTALVVRVLLTRLGL
jgi:hypothetical protein